MTDRVDLHMHSVKSDGTMAPDELARACAKAGLRAAALTDHDSTDGTKAFTEECEGLGIEGIAGVEISARFPRELHIVGLFVGEEINKGLAKLREGRRVRNLEMLDLLRKDGIEITEEDICSDEGSTADTVGRLHIAKAIIKKGYAGSISEVFDTMLGKGKKYYVRRFSYSPEESVELIKNCGGAAVWAHPIYSAGSEKEMTETAMRLKDAGLDAMECLYSRYTDADTELCFRVAEKTGLLKSGGSDFHGANKPGVEPGRVNGGYVPYEFLEAIKARTK